MGHDQERSGWMALVTKARRLIHCGRTRRAGGGLHKKGQ